MRGRVSAAIRAHPLGAFLALAFGLAWGAWALVLVVPERQSVLTVGIAFAPLLAALAVWAGTGDRRGRRRAFRWRVPPRWYALALALPAAFALGGFVVFRAFGGRFVPLDLPTGTLLALVFVQALVLTGGNEEPGWRGLALSHLQERYGDLGGALAVGGVWALWHLPAFLLVPGTPPFVLFVPLALVASVVMAWLVAAAEGSVLPAAAFHAGANTVVFWYLGATDPAQAGLALGALGVAAWLLVGCFLLARWGVRPLRAWRTERRGA
jgi:membrane protease YdiL (CAAX protease family)